MKKLSLLLLSSSVLFFGAIFISCQEDVKLDFEQDIIVTIQGVVYDNNGNVPLSGVKVNLGSDTVATNADGYYVFNNQSSGSYLLRFETEGYATMVQQVSESGREFTANSIVNTSPIFMHEKNQTLTTKFSVSNGLESNPANNVGVILTLDTGSDNIFFENNVLSDTTNSDGVLTVTGLPNIEIEVGVNYVEEGYRYSRFFATRPSEVSVSYDLNRESLSEFKLLESNVVTDEGTSEQGLSASSSISFAFSEVIDESFGGMKVELIKMNGLLEVVVETSIAGNTLIVDPLGASLEAGETYEVNIELQSTAGIGYSRTFAFRIEGGDLVLGQVTGVALDEFHEGDNAILESSDFVILEFSEVDDAIWYQVFGRYSNATDEFVELDTFTAGEVIDREDSAVELRVELQQAGIDRPEDGYFDGGTFTFIVRAVNGNVKGDFSAEFSVEEGDTN